MADRQPRFEDEQITSIPSPSMNAQIPQTPPPAPATPPTVFPPASPETPSTLSEKLKAGDEHWAWKIGFRTCICVVDLIGIGCVASVLANALHLSSNPYLGYLADKEVAPFALVALSLSFVWSLIAILIPVFRRTHHPTHPGVVVAIDLILWLCFIGTVLVTIAAALSIQSFGSDPDYLSDPSYPGDYRGNYYLDSNDNWVYNVTYVWSQQTNDDLRFNSTSNEWYYVTPSTADVVRDCTPYFSSCTEQDAYINAIWDGKPQRFAVDMTAGVVQIIALLLHFALFVWACVDTNRRNRTKGGDAYRIAHAIVQDMQQRGLITVHGNVAIQGGGVVGRYEQLGPEMQMQPQAAPVRTAPVYGGKTAPTARFA